MFIQSDLEQPFYLKLAGQTYSSSAGGFLILSKLTDSAFDIVVGFPLGKYPEYRFHVAPVVKDRGVALKQFEGKGWGLFDLQTMDIQMGELASVVAAPLRTPEKSVATDTFTSVLSSVIDDKGLAETELVRKQDGKPVAAMPGERVKDSAGIASAELPAGVLKERADSLAVRDARVSASAGDKSNAATVPATFTDTMARQSGVDQMRSGGKDVVKADTALSMVASDSSARKAGEKGSLPVATGVGEPAVVRKDTAATATSSMTSVTVPAADTVRKASVTTAAPTPAAAAATRPVRTDCRSMVSVKDLGTLRRRMESISDEDAKVAAALREFKQSCFTTEQVRSLLVVFFREEGRYKLIDAAYPHVYDPGNYDVFLPLLKDPYFIHRFRKLTGVL
jgi:hypothetical protein